MITLQNFPLPLAIAYSGGADSSALLFAAQKQWTGKVTAIHIHHGLQAAADDFVVHCQTQCNQWQVPLHVLHVNAKNAPGQSPEDAARLARYGALAEKAKQLGVKSVLLGHHADDQVETLLLALSRGAGLAGLAAMPAQFERYGMTFHRPFLQRSSQDIRQSLLDANIPFLDDPTNADQAFTRNRIRARVLPVLQETFPQFRQTFARSVQHVAQAQSLLDEMAEQDLQAVGAPPKIKALQQLSNARQANALRYWLRKNHQVVPSSAQLEQLQSQIAACTTRGHRIELKVATGFVRLVDGVLNFV